MLRSVCPTGVSPSDGYMTQSHPSVQQTTMDPLLRRLIEPVR
ncbi:hypothetical protein PVAP13_1NG244057 [Panicum virgatum]|uniref:Uncharacterized protein n=1 Tax=Panicum virgatum TaxID=38727 RepID=A0A8T0WMM2_PANVG|nr:hypothetical protein PVAP13_1NG244057 [Panicum virgatum]